MTAVGGSDGRRRRELGALHGFALAPRRHGDHRDPTKTLGVPIAVVRKFVEDESINSPP